ncbi:MAG: hypothetical protein JXN62_11875 [Bacteroidales bacterium]|nr:hypothetical protein [Bacteroidales bacterium]
MTDNTKHLEKSWNNRANEAKEKALNTIAELKAKKEPVNFHSVHIKSGLSKNYLYTNEAIKAAILKQRGEEKIREKIWHNKYDKTSKSKDVIIETKDKYIAKLEAENQQLRKELNQLRAMIYEQK